MTQTPHPSTDPLTFFKQVLEIPTVSGDGPKSGSYDAMASFLKQKCEDLGLEVHVESFVPHKPIVVASWWGRDRKLPSIVLNSHYDVVPAERAKWNTEPFVAVEKEGKIFARGTQDMKCVLAQYVLAIEAVKRKHPDFQPRRTIHLTFCPDEEIGGAEGMRLFLDGDYFKKVVSPVAFALDEGLANPGDAYTVFYGERGMMWVLVDFKGPTGHGSRFIQNTATEALLKFANKAMEFRRGEENAFLGRRASEGCAHCEAKKLGDVTTVNITMLQAGVPMSEGRWALNVIPSSASAGMDIRIPPTRPFKDMEALMDAWCAEASAGAEGTVTWRRAPWIASVAQKEHHVTSLDAGKDPFWAAFEDVVGGECATRIEPEVFPAGTDSRFIRAMGIPAVGFSPMKNTPILLHENNEWIGTQTFLDGIPVYEKLILKWGVLEVASSAASAASPAKRAKS